MYIIQIQLHYERFIPQPPFMRCVQIESNVSCHVWYVSRSQLNRTVKPLWRYYLHQTAEAKQEWLHCIDVVINKNVTLTKCTILTTFDVYSLTTCVPIYTQVSYVIGYNKQTIHQSEVLILH
jgi:hypothetical protein